MTQPPNKLPIQKPDQQVKIMGFLTLLFFGGIVAYTVLPEGWLRGVGMTIFTGLTFYFLIKGV